MAYRKTNVLPGFGLTLGYTLVYLSLIVPGDNGPRRDHCWRYAPPSNEVVRGYVTPGDYVQVQHKPIS